MKNVVLTRDGFHPPTGLNGDKLKALGVGLFWKVDDMWIYRVVCISLTVFFSSLLSVYAETAAQGAPTPTPVLAIIPASPSPLPLLPTATVFNTPTGADLSPTPAGPVVLEALTEANVRSQPDPDSERLGTIRVGDQYVVIGRYFRWFQFQYNQTSSGVGWVFDELVSIIGDEGSIVDLALAELPAQDSSSAATAEGLDLTPGGVLTSTANSNSVPLPVSTQVSGPNTSGPGDALVVPEVLPTFTFPPNIPTGIAPGSVSGAVGQVTPSPSSQLLNEPASSTTIPPILPILLLGGFGILGLIVSSSRS